MRVTVGCLTVGLLAYGLPAGGQAEARSSPAQVRTYAYTFSTCIDGRDHLIIHGSTLQWQYDGYTAVGDSRPDCGKQATSVRAAIDGAPVLSVDWLPIWSPDPPACGAVSASFAGLDPAFPASANVTLTPLQARGSISISQFPSAANGWTLVLEFNDDQESGAAVYTAQVIVQVDQGPIQIHSEISDAHKQ
jgi:hypothetical protein